MIHQLKVVSFVLELGRITSKLSPFIIFKAAKGLSVALVGVIKTFPVLVIAVVLMVTLVVPALITPLPKVVFGISYIVFWEADDVALNTVGLVMISFSVLTFSALTLSALTLSELTSLAVIVPSVTR